MEKVLRLKPLSAGSSLSRWFYSAVLLSGIVLMGINLTGLFLNLNQIDFLEHEVRFKNDVELTYNESIQLLKRNDGESDMDYSFRVNDVISKRLAHIYWNKYEPEKFNQLVPIWENYFLYFMGKFSGIPEYKRYHFANYSRSLKRGIGICGDASMVMSQVLNKEGIENKIASFNGHVVSAVQLNDGKQIVLDADFGVSMPFSIEEIHQNPSLVDRYYLDQAHQPEQIESLKESYIGRYKLWDGVEHFITKKYYFEKISYALKWPLPIFLILVASICLYRSNYLIRNSD